MKLRATAAAVVLGSALAACNVPGDTKAVPPATPADVTSGGVLRVGITTPGGIDPLDAYEPAGQLLSSTMCDTLVALDPQTGQLREALAQSWVETTDGNLTIKSRHGVTFSNGKELRSSDVNGSLQDLVAPANGSYVAQLAKPFSLALAVQDLSGSKDVLAETDTNAPTIATPLNHYDVQVQTVQPDGGALRLFAEPAMAPIDQAAYTKDPSAFAADPVCVGPYKLQSPYHSGDASLKLIRTKGYYGKNVGYTGGGKGYPDEIDVSIYPTSAAALSAYLEDKVDVVRVTDDQQVRVTGAEKANLVYGPANDVEYLGLPDGASGPLNNADVRQALSLAVDRTKLAQDVFGAWSQPANGFLPPALAISTGPSLNGKQTKAAPLQTCGDLTPSSPDLDRARQLITASKVDLSKGAITLTVNDDAPYPAMAKEVAADWEALGLTVKVVTQKWDDYLTAATVGGGIPTAFRVRWSSHATSPYTTDNDQETYLATLLASNATAFGNLAHWSDRDFDFGLQVDAAPLTEVQQRGIAFAKLGKIACQQMPLVPLVFDRPTYLVRSSAIGSARKVPVGRNGLLMLRELYVKR